MATKRYQIDPSERLDQCPSKGAAVTWPIPLDEHLDLLRATVETCGERTTRRELAAALVFSAPTDGEKLSRILRKYRLATVSELRRAEPGENVIEFSSHSPGPRKRPNTSG